MEKFENVLTIHSTSGILCKKGLYPKERRSIMTIKEARQVVGITQRKLSEILEIPLRTIENWEAGVRTPPPYVEKLIVEKLLSMRDVSIVPDRDMT